MEKKKKEKEITYEISFTSEGKKSKLVIDSSKDTKELSSIWWTIHGNCIFYACTSLSYRLNRNIFEYHFPNCLLF